MKKIIKDCLIRGYIIGVVTPFQGLEVNRHWGHAVQRIETHLPAYEASIPTLWTTSLSHLFLSLNSLSAPLPTTVSFIVFDIVVWLGVRSRPSSGARPFLPYTHTTVYKCSYTVSLRIASILVRCLYIYIHQRLLFD